MGQKHSSHDGSNSTKSVANPYDEKYWRSENLQTKREIGRGSESYVLEALNIKTNIRCAVKIMEYSTRDDPAYKRALEKSRRTYKINKWNNQNLVRTYICEAIEVENNFSLKHKCAIIMDYFEQNLLNVIIQKKALLTRFTERQLLKFALDLTHGLATAHKNGIFHTNIKDENIFLCQTSNLLKLGDFDIPDSHSKKISSPKNVMYLPPEKLQDNFNEPLDWSKVDVYSLGIVLLKLALLKEILNASDRNSLPHLIKETSRISPKFEFILEVMLKPLPEERWSAEKCFKHLQSIFFEKLTVEFTEFFTQEQKEAQSLLEKGLLYKRSEDHRMAMNLFESARNRIIESEPLNNFDRVLIANSLQYSAMTFYDLKDFPNSLTCYMKCLDLKQKYLTGLEIWATLGSVGRLYIKIGDPQKGLYYYAKAFRALKKEAIEVYIMNAPKYLESIGNTYESIGDFTNALENHLLCLEAVKKQVDEKHIRYGKALRNVSRVLRCMGDLQKSKIFESLARNVNF